MVKNPAANAGDIRDTGSIPESERSLGGGKGNSLQYSCLLDQNTPTGVEFSEGGAEDPFGTAFP